MSLEVIAGTIGIAFGVVGVAFHRRWARLIRDPAMERAARIYVIASSLGLIAFGALLVAGVIDLGEGSADADSELSPLARALVGLGAVLMGAAFVWFRRQVAAFMMATPGSWQNRRLQEVSVTVFGVAVVAVGSLFVFSAFAGR